MEWQQFVQHGIQAVPPEEARPDVEERRQAVLHAAQHANAHLPCKMPVSMCSNGGGQPLRDLAESENSVIGWLESGFCTDCQADILEQEELTHAVDTMDWGSS